MGPNQAHPRSRGENSVPVLKGNERIGSSPLTRGKLRCKSSKPTSATAHPRSRGENSKIANVSAVPTGSSPLTRGKHYTRFKCDSITRLIPAHAGKTGSLFSRFRLVGAHPRSRGENPAAAKAMRSPAGSSPLTRGKQAVLFEAMHQRRLIPAHAGKTWRQRR